MPRQADSAPTEYAAPALEKGLDILETLATSAPGLTQNELADALGRTVPEIFRMLDILRRRGWVHREPGTGRHTLSLHLFALAHRHPPTRRLLDAAIPELRRLADSLNQSAHLSVRAGDRLLVLAVAEGYADMGFSVKLGSAYPFAADRSSARVIAAFGDEAARAIIFEGLGPRPAASLRRDLEGIRQTGALVAPSATVAGVTDLCAPVIGADGTAVAALIVPFLERRGGPKPASARAPAAEAAARISAAIGGAPSA